MPPGRSPDSHGHEGAAPHRAQDATLPRTVAQGNDPAVADDLDVRARAVERAHNAWQGLLHDEVAAALRAAATPGAGRLEVRRCARQALAAAEALADPTPGSAPDGPTDLMPVLRQVVAAATARGPTVVGLVGPDQAVVPATAAAAVGGAVAESVRNVERHAAGAPARVLVRHDDQGLTVQVVDDGPGFVVTTRRPGGLDVSVADRMAHAGGSAQVTSVPGRGTTVTLTWPSTSHPGPGAAQGPTDAGRWEDACRTARDEVGARRRARLEEIVLPFLRRLADTGTVDDDVRAQAVLVEQAVRDEMHLPDVLDAPARRAVRTARAHGCRVRVQSDSLSGAPTALVNAVVTVALSVRPAPREVTVSVYTGSRRAENEPARSSEPTDGADEHTDRGDSPRAADEPTGAAEPDGGSDQDRTGQARVAVVAVPGSPARYDALHRAFADRTDVLVDVLTSDDDATWAEIRVRG